jgi:cytochrome P450
MAAMFSQLRPWQWIALAALTAYVALVYIKRYKKWKHVEALGGEAPRVATRFFFGKLLDVDAPASSANSDIGLDFPVHSALASRRNQALEFWDWIFAHTGTDSNGNGSYTVELHLLEDIRVVFTADPENTKALLTTQFQDFGKGEEFHKDWQDFLGDSIFTTDGERWHNSRQLIRPMFVRERVADLPLVENHVRKLISLLGPGDGSAVMLNKLFFRFSLDAATEFLFGHSVGSLDVEQSEFATAFDEVQRVQSLEGRLG